jgi:hypothetical protein
MQILGNDDWNIEEIIELNCTKNELFEAEKKCIEWLKPTLNMNKNQIDDRVKNIFKTIVIPKQQQKPQLKRGPKIEKYDNDTLAKYAYLKNDMNISNKRIISKTLNIPYYKLGNLSAQYECYSDQIIPIQIPILY